MEVAGRARPAAALPPPQPEARRDVATRREAGTGTRVVRRAVAVMRSRIDEPLSVACLALACGTSNRTLHRALRRAHGLSPMALVRRERLGMAREALSRPTEGTTVTQVALAWGFEHLGRFSRYYARQFGELPSDTLRRARVHASGVAAGADCVAPVLLHRVAVEAIGRGRIDQTAWGSRRRAG